jgi:hypothetical protein
MNNTLPSRRRVVAMLLLASLAPIVSTAHGRCNDAAAPVEDALVRLAAERHVLMARSGTPAGFWC